MGKKARRERNEARNAAHTANAISVLDVSRPAPVWGRDLIDPAAIVQLENAMRLPVTIAGALMPDAHVGYGIPIGGIDALENAVAPYMVGVDRRSRTRPRHRARPRTLHIHEPFRQPQAGEDYDSKADRDRWLKEQDVELMDAGMDEAPQAYKDIRQVLHEQSDMVEMLATFRPRLVLVASAGERAED